MKVAMEHPFHQEKVEPNGCYIAHFREIDVLFIYWTIVMLSSYTVRGSDRTLVPPH